MAGGDYKYCDVCNCKAFYDANLDYNGSSDFAESGGFLSAGHKSYLELQNLGNWIVLCKTCSVTHKIKIEAIE